MPTAAAAVQRAVQDDLKAPSQLGIAISPQQEQALMKGLAVSDADRFRSVEELVAGFAAANAAVPSAVTVPPIEQDDLYGSYASKAVESHLGHGASARQEKKNKTSLIVALVAVAATILALGIWMLLQISPDREPTEQEDTPSVNDTTPEKPDEVIDPIVVSVRNVTVEEGIDSLTLSFETDDNPEYWIVSCKEDGKETKRQEFTEIPVEITDLKPDTRYELELLVSEDAMLEEPVVQVGKTKAGATVVKDSFTVEQDGNEAEISWQSEGTQPEQWQVTVTGDKGYREELDAEEASFTLKDLVYGEIYTVEISCEYMAEAFTETFTADSLYIDAMTAELTDDGAVDVQWQCPGGEDVTWYVVCTPDDAPEQAWTQETTKQNIRLTNLRAGKTYTIELRTKEGDLLDGDSAVSIDIPASGTFSDYGFTDASAEFYLRPEGRKWDTEDLEDRRTSFSDDEQIVFVCVPTSSPDSSRDKVIVTLMVKDKTGNTVDFFNIEEKWDTLWKDGSFATELENTPVAGTYTVELYFNSLPVSLSQNSFTIEE